MKDKEKTIKTLAVLSRRAGKLRATTKGAIDEKFLNSIFHDKNWESTNLKDKLEMLAKIYSVSRTVKIKKMAKKVAGKEKLFAEYANDKYARTGLHDLLKHHPELGINEVKTAKKQINFFNQYGMLLRLLKKRKTTINDLDAFFWLYGVIQNIEKQETNKKFWWSGTCGYMGDKNTRNWYFKVKKFMMK